MLLCTSMVRRTDVQYGGIYNRETAIRNVPPKSFSGMYGAMAQATSSSFNSSCIHFISFHGMAWQPGWTFWRNKLQNCTASSQYMQQLPRCGTSSHLLLPSRPHINTSMKNENQTWPDALLEKARYESAEKGADQGAVKFTIYFCSPAHQVWLQTPSRIISRVCT